MRARRDFLAARKGERRGGPLFTIEVLDRGRTDPALRDAPPRLGMTVTRKMGNAVTRNRIRRRLREAVRTEVARDMRPGHDYVIVARPEAATVEYGALVSELRARVTAPARTGKAPVRTGKAPVRAGKAGSGGPRSGEPRTGRRHDRPMERKGSPR